MIDFSKLSQTEGKKFVLPNTNNIFKPKKGELQKLAIVSEITKAGRYKKVDVVLADDEKQQTRTMFLTKDLEKFVKANKKKDQVLICDILLVSISETESGNTRHNYDLTSY